MWRRKRDDQEAQILANRLAVYHLALQEARTGFDELMQQPERIRRNVGALLGFAGVAVSIFGFAIQPRLWSFGWFAQLIATLGVVGLVVCTVIVSLPKDLTPSMDPKSVIDWANEGDTEERAVLSLALGIDANYRNNRPIVMGMFKAQIVAASFFGVTVLALAARLIGA